jgi:hypothetical protein
MADAGVGINSQFEFKHLIRGSKHAYLIVNMQRPSSVFNDSKGFGLDMTRTSLNYRPSTNFRETVKCDEGFKGKSKLDLLFNSIAPTEIPKRRTHFHSFLDSSIVQNLSRRQSSQQKRSIPKASDANEEIQTIQSKMFALRKTLCVRRRNEKENKSELSRKKFLSFFGETNFAPIDYSLVPKDQVLFRLLAQPDFSLVRLIAFLSERMPHQHYKLHQVCSLFDQDLEGDRSERLQLVVTKEMVLHQFLPESRILRIKLLNTSRLDNLERADLTIKTRRLISEVLRQSFNK